MEKTMLIVGLLAISTLGFLGSAWGQGMGGHSMHGAAQEQGKQVMGKPGDPAKISRTLEISLNDTMRFTPDKITVQVGETLRFKLTNSGKLVHEYVLGAADELKAHAEEMRKHPGMMQNEPNAISLEPGKSGFLVWQFTEKGAVNFACLVPGHLEAGMVGTVIVE